MQKDHNAWKKKTLPILKESAAKKKKKIEVSGDHCQSPAWRPLPWPDQIWMNQESLLFPAEEAKRRFRIKRGRLHWIPAQDQQTPVGRWFRFNASSCPVLFTSPPPDTSTQNKHNLSHVAIPSLQVMDPDTEINSSITCWIFFLESKLS